MEDDFEEITTNNYKKITTTLNKIGYTDGIVDGRDSQFQSGFDFGYKDGLEITFEIAKWKAIFEVLKNCGKNLDNKIVKKLMESEQCDIINASNSKHFQMLKAPDKSVQHSSEAQKQYTTNIRKELNNKYDLIKKLLD